MQPHIKFIGLILFIQVEFAFSQAIPTPSGSKMSPQDAHVALDFHNKVRQDVGSPPLEWSSELATYAQTWADHLAESTCKMMHRPQSGKWKQLHGENIFWGSDATHFSVVDACNQWYGEIKQYRHEAINQTNYIKTGHYTQMVWKNTTKVGMAQATCKSGAILIVANYDPPGNYIAQKAY